MQPVASDAAHYCANVRQRNPFPAVYNVGDNPLSFDTAVRLAASPDHVIPGHYPLVMRHYPAPWPNRRSGTEIDSLLAGQ